mmetsp:Transcript_74930/g.242281  ORF Transcript_74930/g.242281 Transcript_74930/m.242281 type:complete len:227 (-) Transcript_74930:8-688(-)
MAHADGWRLHLRSATGEEFCRGASGGRRRGEPRVLLGPGQRRPGRRAAFRGEGGAGRAHRALVRVSPAERPPEVREARGQTLDPLLQLAVLGLEGVLPLAALSHLLDEPAGPLSVRLLGLAHCVLGSCPQLLGFGSDPSINLEEDHLPDRIDKLLAAQLVPQATQHVLGLLQGRRSHVCGCPGEFKAWGREEWARPRARQQRLRHAVRPTSSRPEARALEDRVEVA